MALRPVWIACAALVLVGCHRNSHSPGGPAAAAADPAEVAAGERLFLETRFAQFFAANSGGNLNLPLASGDPAVDTLPIASGGNFGGPFAGQSMNCRQCHLVDEVDGASGGGIRTYGDFALRSAIPDRGDGRSTTPRNSPPLVNASVARNGPFFLHFDGEFATAEDLVRATLTGRNYGWLASEAAAAVAHVAAVIRADNGAGDLATEFGGLSYAELFAGGAAVPVEFRLPLAFQLDVTTATDQQLLDGVAALVAAYMTALEFARDAAGAFSGSPYDKFLEKNALPSQPDSGETDADYTERLASLIDALASPVFVTASDGVFVHHDQPFAFGATELAGLKVFFAEPSTTPPPPAELSAGGFGNCTACHVAPSFSDHLFHNIGTAQAEYEGIHGGGTFAAMTIPSLATRATDLNQFLPPNGGNPAAEGIFLRVPDASDARFTDLGMWNVFANAAVPTPQTALHDLVATMNGLDPLVATNAQLLPLTIATFKTPGVRDLADGAPYMHTGQFAEIEDVLGHYLSIAGLARAGAVRNEDAALAGIAIKGSDIAALAAFLRALNEDYD